MVRQEVPVAVMPADILEHLQMISLRLDHLITIQVQQQPLYNCLVKNRTLR